jgi:hypothetical protein
MAFFTSFSGFDFLPSLPLLVDDESSGMVWELLELVIGEK